LEQYFYHSLIIGYSTISGQIGFSDFSISLEKHEGNHHNIPNLSIKDMIFAANFQSVSE